MAAKDIDRLLKAKKELSTQINDQDQIVRDLQKQLTALRRRRDAIDKELRQMAPVNLNISDHAILRYGERYLGWPIEGAKAAIAEALKGAELLVDLKVRGFVIRDSTVVTYYPPVGESGRINSKANQIEANKTVKANAKAAKSD